jgi:DNA-directed RNA polymerase specialized sigma24 family protein
MVHARKRRAEPRRESAMLRLRIQRGRAMARLYERGLSYQEIADVFGVDSTCVAVQIKWWRERWDRTPLII